MESEQRHYKLRSGSRSRSRTPLVQSHALIDSEISDRRCDPRTRSREGSRTPVDITHPRSKPVNSSKTNEHNTDTIVESQGGIVTVSPPLDATKKIERRSERQKAKRHLYANGQTGSKDNLAGSKTEKISKNASSHRILTSDYSSEEGDREDLSGRPSSAHEIYKQAGDWWNVFPKTDYTYSERSQCRYEVAPGVLAMPNMSRRSIRSNTDDTNLFSCCPSESDLYETADMSKGERAKAENRTLVDEHHESRTSKSNGKSEVLYAKARVERHSCHREIIYATSQSTANSGSRQQLSSDTSLKRYATRRYNVASSFDSDAESEDVVTSSHNNRLRRGAQQLVGSMSIIVLRLRKLFEFLKHTTIKRREYRATNDYRIHESKWFRMWRYLDRFFQYIYLFMVKVFFFDSWLLSRVSAVRKWIRHKSPMVLWVTVLPLLLLTGCWCLPYPSTLFLPSKVITTPFRESAVSSVVSGKRTSSNWETLGMADDFESIIDTLNSRISSLEDRVVEHTDRLPNVSLVLDQLRESEYVWSKYNNEISLLEKGLVGHKLADMYTREMDIFKSQFEKLKELYSELKSCCHTHANYVTSEHLEKRIEMVVTDYIGALMLKKGGTKVQEPSMVNDNVVTDERVREIVKEALKVYDADKTGRVDYALESAGGQVISTRCTQRYDIKTRAFKLLAFTLYHENNNPRTVIQGNPIQPGACWAFQGFPGYLLIKLRSSIYVTGFTVEHAPTSILPNGEMKSAPKMFNVWGFVDENDPEPVMFGDYEFTASGDNLQYFPVQNTTIKASYEYVELRIHSNHGQLEYTCLYRFRVHGKSA